MSKKKANPNTREGKVFSTLIEQAVLRTRSSIADWRSAIRIAENVYNPKRVKLYNLYADIELDAFLSSQIDNRKLKTKRSPFELIKPSGEVDEEATKTLQESKWINNLFDDLLDTIYYGFTVIEFYRNDIGELDYRLIPRKHVIPEQGLITVWEGDLTGTQYRQIPEFGNWILEFGKPKDLGLLNKTVPLVLFKRFATSCWSELCEIYGIPPRIGKTNTQDPEMLGRMERMMRDMGSAAWMIIDDTEDFEFAQGVQTKGEVYQELIRLCSNEISLRICGAVIGQDTKNGNESKETVSVEMLEQLVDSDKILITNWFNSTLLPALWKIGFLPDGLKFKYQKQPDIEALWKMTSEVLKYKDVDDSFIKDTFGIPVKPLAVAPAQQTKLSGGGGFFA